MPWLHLVVCRVALTGELAAYQRRQARQCQIFGGSHVVSQVGVDITQIWIGMSTFMGWVTWKVKADRGLGTGWFGRT